MITIDELIETLSSRGYPVTKSKLAYYTRQGLLPEPQKLGERRGGVKSVYPDADADAAMGRIELRRFWSLWNGPETEKVFCFPLTSLERIFSVMPVSRDTCAIADYVGLPTKFGNHFDAKGRGRAWAVACFRTWPAGELDEQFPDLAARRKGVLQHLAQLRGKNLS
jgi:hypothetical protein